MADEAADASGISPSRFEAMPSRALDRARWWERHVLEVVTGRDPVAGKKTPSDPRFDPRLSSLAVRDAAKARQLSAGTGREVSAATVKRMRLRYARDGLAGLVDGRSARKVRSSYGRNDPRLVEALHEVLASHDSSALTRVQLAQVVRERLDAVWGSGAVAMPSQATFNRLVVAANEDGPVARPARSPAANRRPPESREARSVAVETIGVPLRAREETGRVHDVELTVAVDTTARSVEVALVHPQGLAAADLGPIVLRILTTAPVLSRHVFTSSASYGANSESFLETCRRLGVLVITRPYRSNSASARLAREVASRFTAFVTEYRSVMSAAEVASGPAPDDMDFTALQRLLDLWRDRVWQQSRHPMLLDPSAPGLILSPAEARSTLTRNTSAGTPHLLGEDRDFVDLLPMRWCTVRKHGIQLHGLTYGGLAFHALLGTKVGRSSEAGRVAVRFDPFDRSHIWAQSGTGGLLRLERVGDLSVVPEEALQRTGPMERTASSAETRSSTDGDGNPLAASVFHHALWGVLWKYSHNHENSQDRIDFHALLDPWPTSLIEELRFHVHRAVAHIANQAWPHRGLTVVTGPPGTGKTTAMLEAAKDYLDPLTGDVPPIVYFRMPTRATPRTFIFEFAHAQQIKVPRRRSAMEATEMVYSALNERGCELLLFDDAHLATDETVSLMHIMAANTPASMIAAGVDLVQTSFRLLANAGTHQGGYKVIEARNFGYATSEERLAWFSLIAAAERSLRLRAHKPGTLTAHADYLHHRTNGNISALSYLISLAAREAILNTTECINYQTLQGVIVDALW